MITRIVLTLTRWVARREANRGNPKSAQACMWRVMAFGAGELLCWPGGHRRNGA